ncbi:MAG TPA: hypothetical protein VHD34_03690 [Xanthobacteraceae bacterium]|nr:hypothetical protein [Xanthobacteraceae bacterium]
MRRKQIQFNNDVYLALQQLANDRMATFQELADEAFADVLKKHKRPVGLADALKQSAAATRGNVVDMKSRRRIRRK